MLVLSRKLNEKILLPGTRTAIQVVGIKAGVVRLGIEAPPEVLVLREEIPDRSTEWAPKTPPAPAVEAKPRSVRSLTANRLQIARAELAELKRQLQEGQLHQAETTLERLDEELRALRQRMETEPEKPTSLPLPRKTR